MVGSYLHGPAPAPGNRAWPYFFLRDRARTTPAVTAAAATPAAVIRRLFLRCFALPVTLSAASRAMAFALAPALAAAMRPCVSDVRAWPRALRPSSTAMAASFTAFLADTLIRAIGRSLVLFDP